MTDESLVLEKKAKMEKKKKKSVDPVALLRSQLAEQALSDNAYNGSTDDDGEALQKAMILLSQHYQKKFQPRTGSNSSRFTSVTRAKVPEPKTATCYNYGKPGHISKECRAKKVKDSTYYRKKLELAEKREKGTALLVEEEFWLDHFDNDVSNVEIAHMCLVEDDQSDDSDTDEDEVYTDFDYNFISSQMKIIITSLSDLRFKLISEKNLNTEKSDLIDKLKISLKDEKSILENTKDIFQKKLDDLENSNKTYLESLMAMTNLNDEFSDKINRLEEKLYRRNQSEQTIFMNKPRSEEALKQRTLSKSKKQIWRTKRTSDEHTFDGDKCLRSRASTTMTSRHISLGIVIQCIKLLTNEKLSVGCLSSGPLRSFDLGVIEPKSFYRIISKVMFYCHFNSFAIPAPTTTVHSRSFKRGVSSRAQADESTERC
ncbi:hypothetical protein L6452_14956 [Arctium lappa]|uniref:Uncharacterized protein n=1 Tax=Arctium lappa TaxID=4217 RepID=A0ACB9CM97_ARCLA|nr:hypothetical protein L6452_14956 [Arctium lappa]